MKISFIKMHGCGNDFVVIDGRSQPKQDWKNLAPKLLDRRFGVGGDSLLILLPSKTEDAKMLVYEKDRRESEMCGNGIRCLARLLYEEGNFKKLIRFETKAGKKIVEVETLDRIRVDMGPPLFHAREIPVAADRNLWGKEVEVAGQKVELHTLSMGNPHAVIFVDRKEDLSWVSTVGPELSTHSLFPNQANVEFVYVRNENEMDVRVWERSAGETWACGTGACASAVAALIEKKVKNPVQVHFKGGTVEIFWKEGEPVFMTGPATKVFEGKIEL